MPSLKQLVIATHNPGKLSEMREILGAHIGTLVSAAEIDAPDVVEDAETLQGNAEKKARSLYNLTGEASIGDDTGLEVTALDGRPGVYSARYAGPNCTPDDNIDLLMEELADSSDRTARFRTVIAYVDADGTRFFEGTCAGVITEHRSGGDGFGYDPVFLPEGETLTFAAMPKERKNAISHRGRALQAFLVFLQS